MSDSPVVASTADEAPATYDVIVVGLGGLGAATTYQLARAGVRVLGVEQFALGHDRGASHDTSRILRHSYHRADYVDLTKQAYDDWAELEAASGQRLVTRTGGIDLCPAAADLSLDVYAASLAGAGIAYELLDGREIQARWPQVRVEESTAGLYQERTGIVSAGRTTATLHGLAASSGAVLVDRTPVLELREHPESVEVVTARRTFAAQSVVICADAWTAGLVAPLGWAPRLTVLDQQVTYFQPGRPDAFAPDKFPVWIWIDDPGFYGFPCYGEPTIKAGQDCGGPAVDPDKRTPGTDDAALGRLSQFMAETFPGSGPAVRSVRCLYTLPADRDFVLGAVPGSQRAHLALGAGHAFKFVPTIGRLLAAMALGQHDRTAEWVQSFSPERAALTDPDYPIQWMV